MQRRHAAPDRIAILLPHQRLELTASGSKSPTLRPGPETNWIHRRREAALATIADERRSRPGFASQSRREITTELPRQVSPQSVVGYTLFSGLRTGCRNWLISRPRLTSAKIGRSSVKRHPRGRVAAGALAATSLSRDHTHRHMSEPPHERSFDFPVTSRFLFRAIVSPQSPRTSGCGPERALTRPTVVSLPGIACALRDRKANLDRRRSEQADLARSGSRFPR